MLAGAVFSYANELRDVQLTAATIGIAYHRTLIVRTNFSAGMRIV